MWLAFILSNYFFNFKIDFSALEFGFKGLNFSLLKILETSLFHIYSIVLTILFLISSFLIGNRFFKDRLLSIGIGFGIFGYLIFFLGIFKLLYPVLIVLLWFVLLLFFIILQKKYQNNLNYLKIIPLNLLSELKEIKKEFSDIKIFFFVLVLFFLISVLVNFIGSLTPEIFYDSLLYHLGLPKLYLINHKIFNVQENLFSNYPSLGEMLYTLAISVQGDEFGKLINFSVSILCAVVIYLISRKLFNRKTGILSVAIFYITPIVSTLSWTTGVDLFVVFFVLLSLYAFISNLSSYTVGIFAGLALSCKLTAVFFIPAFFILYIIKKVKLNEILIFVIIIFVMISPWLIKNVIYTGNPVFPHLRNLFGGPVLNEDSFKILISELKSIKIRNVLDFFMFPWNLTLNVPAFGRYMIGPMFLFLIPLTFIQNRFKQSHNLKHISLFFLVAFILWIITTNLSRYFLPGLAILSIILAYSCERVFNSKNILKYILFAGISVLLLINTCWSFYLLNFYFKPFGVVTGLQSREEYLYEKPYQNYYVVFKYINENLPDGSKILFVGETRGFHSQKNFVTSTVFNINPFIKLLKTCKNSEEIYKNLKNKGFTHILINFSEIRRINSTYKIFNLTSDEIKLFEDFRKKYMEILFEAEGTYVFKMEC